MAPISIVYNAVQYNIVRYRKIHFSGVYCIMIQANICVCTVCRCISICHLRCQIPPRSTPDGSSSRTSTSRATCTAGGGGVHVDARLSTDVVALLLASIGITTTCYHRLVNLCWDGVEIGQILLSCHHMKCMHACGCMDLPHSFYVPCVCVCVGRRGTYGCLSASSRVPC